LFLIEIPTMPKRKRKSNTEKSNALLQPEAADVQGCPKTPPSNVQDGDVAKLDATRSVLQAVSPFGLSHAL
jgi:hypothetical protein